MIRNAIAAVAVCLDRRSRLEVRKELSACRERKHEHETEIHVHGCSYDASTAFPAVLDLPDVATVDMALDALHQQLPDKRSLPGSCLVVLSGKHLGTVARHGNPVLAATDELVLIAPVAGG